MVTNDSFVGYDDFLSRSYNFQTDIFLRSQYVVTTAGRLGNEVVQIAVISAAEHDCGCPTSGLGRTGNEVAPAHRLGELRKN